MQRRLMMEPITSIALKGLEAASNRVNRAARNIAGIGNPDGGGGDIVDISTDMVAMIEAQVMFAASVKAVKAANEMSGNLLDLLA